MCRITIKLDNLKTGLISIITIISIEKLDWFITKNVQITFRRPLIYINKLKIMLSEPVALEI